MHSPCRAPNPCIRTGADILFEQYPGLIHGDLFRVGDTFILNSSGCNSIEFVISGMRYHMRVSAFEQIGQTIRAWTVEDCSDFCYEGWTRL